MNEFDEDCDTGPEGTVGMAGDEKDRLSSGFERAGEQGRFFMDGSSFWGTVSDLASRLQPRYGWHASGPAFERDH